MESGVRTTLYLVLGTALLTVMAVPSLIMLLQTETTQDCLSGAAPGGGSAVSATYAGPGLAGLDQRQTQNAAAVVAQGQEMGAPEPAIVIALAVASQESTFLNYANDGSGGDLAGDQTGIARSLDLPHDAVGTDHGSLGLFQQQWPWWGSMEELMDPATSARIFYEALDEVPGWEDMPLTVAAQTVQRSAFPDAYADDEPIARSLLDALTQPGAISVAAPGPAAGAAAPAAPAAGGEDPYGLGDVKPQLRALVDLLAPMFGIETVGGYRASATDPGGHPSGLAADFMVPLTPAGREQGQRLTDYAQANAEQLGIDYIIWYQEIWSVARAGEGWRPMEDRGDPTQNHMDHPHINVLPDADPSTIGAGATAASFAGVATSTDPACDAILAAAGVTTATAGSGITVASLNLLGAGHTGPGGRPGFAGWDQRLPRAMQAMQAAGVTVAGLQEVHAAQAQGLASPRYAQQWGMHPTDGPAQNRVVWNKTAWKPLNRRMVDIPYFDGSPTPMPLVKLRARGTSGTGPGETMWVWSVHNPADVKPGQKQHRIEGLRRQAETVRRLKDRGEQVVLTGDFNDAGDDGQASHCRLVPLMTNAFPGGTTSRTGPCRKPPRAAPVDHIYGANLDWSGAQVVESVKSTKISDHPLITATVAGSVTPGAAAAGAGGPVVHPMSQASAYSTAGSYGDTGEYWANGHTGEDFSASCGEPVVAATAGTAQIHTDQSWAGPQLVVIETGEGGADTVATWYAHMQTVSVQDGAPVQAGQVIGEVGTEGNSTGCHLHFEVHSENRGYDVDDVDPLAWLASFNVPDGGT